MTDDRVHKPVVFLYRGKETPHGTFGSLVYRGQTLCYTLEEPDRNNQNNISCIPQGRYFVTRHRWETPQHPKSGWLLHDVPNRKGILIHVGNTLIDTEGCILVGMRPAPNGVADSRVALNMLKNTLPAEFWIEVTRK